MKGVQFGIGRLAFRSLNLRVNHETKAATPVRRDGFLHRDRRSLTAVNDRGYCLLFVSDCSWCLLLQLDLRTHLLDLRGLLFELGC